MYMECNFKSKRTYWLSLCLMSGLIVIYLSVCLSVYVCVYIKCHFINPRTTEKTIVNVHTMVAYVKVSPYILFCLDSAVQIKMVATYPNNTEYQERTSYSGGLLGENTSPGN